MCRDRRQEVAFLFHYCSKFDFFSDDQAFALCDHFDLLARRVYAEDILLHMGGVSHLAILIYNSRLIGNHKLSRQVCVMINREVAEHAGLNNIVPLLGFKQACAHCVLSTPHKLNPADDFHLFFHFQVAHVNQLVLDGKALPAALAHDRLEQPLEALTYALPEADTNARPNLRFSALGTEPLWLHLTDVLNLYTFIFICMLGEERMMTDVGDRCLVL